MLHENHRFSIAACFPLISKLFLLFPKQKSKQKAFFKFSKDFFHFTALHEKRRLRIAACFSLISQCYRMGLGAIPQASRLNLGKFRGSRSGGLNKVLRTKIDLSSHEVSFKESTRILRSNREVRNSIKIILLTT